MAAGQPSAWTLTRDQGSGTDWQYLLGGKDERAIRVTGATSGSNVTRREMSRFLTEAKVQAGQWSLTGTLCTEPALSGGHPFTDVDCADPDWTLIQTFYENGVTAGCGGNAYCPDVAVTRAQMSVFLLKSEHGSTYTPPPCTGIFADVPCPSQYADWIEELYNEGITAGCGGNNFCPNNNATEFQMAGFLSKGPNSFGPGMWPNYHGIPGGAYYTVRGQDDHLVTEFADSFPSTDNVFLGNTLVASYVSKSPLVTTAAWHLHSSDHLGTVRLSVDGKTGGGVVESHKYWPYGDDTAGVLPLQKLAFAAMERDVESNHFYDHARHHDFNLGRFVSPDTLGGRRRTPQSWNRYTYSIGNPLVRVDPDGLTSIDIFILREAQTERATQGSFFVQGTSIRGRTLELRDLGNQNWVSRVRSGTYQATREDNAALGPILRLHDVPGRPGVLVHPGNTPNKSTGCILVGSACTKDPDTIAGSRPALRRLTDYIDSVADADQERGEETSIRVHILNEVDSQQDATVDDLRPWGSQLGQPFPSPINFETASEQFHVLRPSESF